MLNIGLDFERGDLVSSIDTQEKIYFKILIMALSNLYPEPRFSPLHFS